MLKGLENIIKEMDIDSMLISDIHNVRYLSGYKGDESYLLISEKSNYFITDARYTEQAAIECPEFVILDWKALGRSINDAIAYITEKEELKLMGIEEVVMSHKQYAELDKMISTKTCCISGIIEDLRTVKQPHEKEYLRKACAISDRAFNRILNDIKVGITEAELSAKLAYYLKIEGSDARCYENIFLSGPRTSLLHGIPSDRKITYGDIILMDFGAGYNGYLSDMSRTVVLGKANEKQKEIYNIIKESEEDVINMVKSGIAAKEAYHHSLKAVSGTEYMSYFYTGIGHGVGLAVHEKPYMSAASTDIIKKDNVITVEPGIYIPGWGGVRIEDQILITDDGCEILTNSSRQLIEL